MIAWSATELGRLDTAETYYDRVEDMPGSAGVADYVAVGRGLLALRARGCSAGEVAAGSGRPTDR